MNMETFVNFFKTNKTKLIIADILTGGALTGIATATALATTAVPVSVTAVILPPMS